VHFPSRRTRAIGVAETRDATSTAAKTDAFMMMSGRFLSEEKSVNDEGLRGRDSSMRINKNRKESQSLHHPDHSSTYIRG
jgi:hypothetical protein